MRAEKASVSRPRCSYHVYLSYRGQEISMNFINILHTALTDVGIQTFKRHSESRNGKTVGSELQKAVKESRISIVVFTEDYGYSRRCLDELVSILERKQIAGHMILPVFYRVDPSHVRKQRGSFAKAFHNYEEQIMVEKVERRNEHIAKIKIWRSSLTDVANMAGIVLEDGDELKFIQEIVKEIWGKLSRKVLSFAPYPVGIYSRVKEVNFWLQDSSTNSRTLMIYGEPGIGKTTIAKALFNLHCDRFQCSSFLGDIREIAKESCGLIDLQKNLLSDLLKEDKIDLNDIDRGASTIKDFLVHKKFLLVLDDVDDLTQLKAILDSRDWIPPGSKVIITTTNEHLLNPHDACLMYESKRMDNHEALKLFSLHTFGQDHPVKEYMTHSKQIVKHCQGLPLALQVLASSLHGGSIDMWEGAIKKLERYSESHNHKVLELSYEALPDDHDKNVFLDIASFFVGKDKDYTIKVLDECGFHATAEIQNLIDRYLLTVTPDNKLMMHQLLQEMGKEVICRESPIEPGKRSRIWHHKDALSILHEETVTESIEGLVLKMRGSDESKPDRHECISKRPYFNDSQSTSTLTLKKKSSKRLRVGCLSWGHGNSVSARSQTVQNEAGMSAKAFSKMQELRYLELENVQLSGSFEGFPKKLRWMRWYGFQSTSFPNGFPHENLVVLEMSNSNLHQTWAGAKSVRSLKILDLGHSHSLMKTPDFSGLPNLERVILEDCISLVKVHESIGRLHKLLVLNLKGCESLKKLPRKIWEIKSLEELTLCGCSKLELSRIMRNGKFLQALTRDVTNRDQFPSKAEKPICSDSLSAKSVNSIFWSWMSLWPKPAGSMSDIFQITLQSLDISHSNLTDTLIPCDLSVLSSLKYLSLRGNPISTLPESLKRLTMLQSLQLADCTRLQWIPELPLSLQILNARNCRSLNKVTNLPNFMRSLDLHLENCEKLVEVQGVFKLDPIGDIDDILDMSCLDNLEVRAVDVELCNYLSSTKSKGPVQGLYEFGINNIYIPGGKVPTEFSNISTGSSIDFTVPPLPNAKIQGLNICVAYAECLEECFSERHFIKVSNKTKGIKWIYGPTIFGIAGSGKPMLWFSHWRFGNQLERGDQVVVSLGMGCLVKEFGVNLVCNEQSEEEEDAPSLNAEGRLHPSSYPLQHAIGGDLSPYELSSALVGAGWRTFKDDNEIERGENIKTELENAIRNSRSSIIILSKNYATSTWCLDELVKILEHKRTKGHAILPVFYHVDPSEVRDQTKSFAEAFSTYERQIEAESDEGKREWMDKVQKWRAALGEVADLGGVLVNNQEDRKESEFIEEILQLIEDKLNRTISSVAPYLVGISSRVKNIVSWLQDGSHDDNLIAICGMSGIGKTTVAKYVFTTNFRRFEGSSFLANIQDISQQNDGLIRLQKQLLYDLTGKKSKIQDTDEGIIKIRDAICFKRVLVILDDIDQIEQIHAIIGMKNWFCPGSKIIITTKNSCLLKVEEIQKVHKVREMGNDESLELFSWHSFGEDHPADDYMELSKRVVKHCGGLPLALQVLGSSLCGRSIDVWKSALDKLEAIPASQVIKKLKFGYDSLKDDHDKNLFLDIACFFTRKDKDYVIAVLDESYIYTRVGIQNLTDRFLLTIEGNKLIMHQMIRDMGREIVRQESSKKPGRRTRLWHYKDSFNVLREDMGSETIEGLFFDMNMVKEDQSFMGSSSSGRKWLLTEVKSYRFGFSRHTSNFSSKTLNELELGTNLFTVMNKLRLLQINYTHLNGAYKDFPKNLRWLYWRGFPLKCVPNDFPLESLSVLDMRNSCLERLWEGRRVLPLVKILNLSHSHSLFRTPDFSGLPMLEKLVLKECVNLIEVHESIGTLEARLIFLNIKNCKRLKKLPREICKLKVLKTFIISGCSNLVELPRDLWRMQSLEVFLANEIPMCQLPSKRKQNSIWHALIQSWLPKPRKVLDLPWVSLPKSLVNLSLSGCNLSDVAFPRDFSNLMLLQNLDLSKNPISCLPDCVRTLSRLNSLELGSCTMLKLLIDLPRIHNLRLGHCTSLERVTYLSEVCRAVVYHLNGCKALTDMEGNFKLEAMGGIEIEKKSLELSMWDSVGSSEVKLYNNSTNTESRGPVKVLFERGMISIYLPGSKVPNWFCYKSAGATLSFAVPSPPDLKIQGITVCSVYTIDWKVWIAGIEFYLIIHNEQKNVKLIYSPTCYGLPEAQNEMLWFTHLIFLSQLDAGDTLNVSVVTMEGFSIKEMGIHLMHDEQVDMILNSNSHEMQKDYPYQGMTPAKRQGLVDLYCFGHIGPGLDYILPYIP